MNETVSGFYAILDNLDQRVVVRVGTTLCKYILAPTVSAIPSTRKSSKVPRQIWSTGNRIRLRDLHLYIHKKRPSKHPTHAAIAAMVAKAKSIRLDTKATTSPKTNDTTIVPTRR